ncbi:MAG: hypothetical protein QMD77_00935 [Patescibacteria group bacterium]|nr:hypothetical protein [Patescibacteria group bacterium]
MDIGDTNETLIKLVTAFGVFVVVWTYQKNRFREKHNIIKAMLAQLESLRLWASADNEGWKDPPTDEQKMRYIEIFDLIYKMNNGVINQSLIMPGIVDFSDKLILAVAEFNQLIDRIHSLSGYRNTLTLNQYELCRRIERKLRKYKKSSHSPRTYDDFLNTLKNDEKYITQQLYILYYRLHSGNIGTSFSGGLKQNYHIIYDELKLKEEKLKNLEWGNFLLYLLLIFLIYVIISFVTELFNLGQLFNGVLLLCFSIIIFLLAALFKLVR